MFTVEIVSADHVMNDATSFLESADVPVTPDNQYTMLAAWSASFAGRQDDYSYEMSTALCLAMIRLAPHLSVPIEF